MFEGGGRETLDWMEKCLIPLLPKLLAKRNRRVGGADSDNTPGIYIMGYSLAGLFAAWVLYESDCFDGAICCSSSFWLEGWREYVQGRSVRREAIVYLSLGGKEEKTRHPVMATVGDRTREMEKRLKMDPNVRKCVLEMNSGGHFADAANRMSKGLAFVLGETGGCYDEK